MALKHLVSLRYDTTVDDAPYVDIIGNGGQPEVDYILEIADRYGIPVIEDAELARALSACEEYEAIPVSLYRAVAIVLQHLQSVFAGNPHLSRVRQYIP